MIEDKTELNIRDMLERVWRNRDNIFLFQLVTIVATLFVILFWPRAYSSEAQLFIQRGRESVGLDPMATTGQMISLQQSGRDEEIKTAMEVLSSRGVIAPVVDRLGPGVVLGHEPLDDADQQRSGGVAGAIKSTIGWGVDQIRKIDPASDRERAIVAIEKGLVIDAERKSEVVRIAYESGSPQLAQHVVKAIVEDYTKMHPELHRTKGSADFFEAQSKRLRADFQDSSDRLSAAKNAIGLMSIREQTTIVESRLGNVRTDTMSTEKNLSAAKAEISDLGQQLKTTPARLSSTAVSKPNHAADLQSQSLFAKKIELSEAEARFTPSHPRVVSLRQSVRTAESEFEKLTANREESTENINPVYESLRVAYTKKQAEIAGFEAAFSKLNAQEKEALASISKFNDDSIAIRLLEVEVQNAENKLIAYGNSLEDARVDEERQAKSMSSVTVAQPATLQEKPVAPSKPIVGLVGIMMGLAGSLLIALLSIQNDDTLISPYAVASRLDEVPVLGSLPRSRSFSKVLA